MRLLVLLSRFPYPLEKGDKLRAYYQLKELSKYHEICLCCLSDIEVKPSDIANLEPFCKEIHILQLSKFEIISNLFFTLFSNTPFQVMYFYSIRVQNKFNLIVKNFNPQHIYCQLIRTAKYVANIHEIGKTIDYMDALSEGMYKRVFLQPFYKKWIFQIEADRLKKYESDIFLSFNHHTIISEQDREFINHIQKNNIQVIENGINEEFFAYHKTDINPLFDLVFVGNMNYPPNIEASEYIANKILSKLNSNTKLLLSGATPHKRVLALKNNRVEVSGWVNDIRSVYCSGKIFVAPLFIGTGLQNKLLEAMALSIPCVTTSLCNNALKALPNKEILIANSTEEFVIQIKKLLQNPDYALEIGEAGKNYIKANFSWEKSVNRLNELIIS